MSAAISGVFITLENRIPLFINTIMPEHLLLFRFVPVHFAYFLGIFAPETGLIPIYIGTNRNISEHCSGCSASDTQALPEHLGGIP